MRIQPLVTVKKAAAVLGVDKETIRTKLASGEIKGERRRVGSKDKWFVYPGQLEQLMEQKDFLALDELEKSERLDIDDMVELFDEDEQRELPGAKQSEESSTISSMSPAHQSPEDRQQLVPAFCAGTSLEVKVVLEQLIQTMTREFSQALSEEKRRAAQLEVEIEEQKQILKVASESELAANLKAAALNEELSALKSTVSDLKMELSTKNSWWRRLFGC